MPELKPTRGLLLNKSHLLARGLVGYWLLNEGSGNKVFDLSGDGNIGDFAGAPYWIAGKYGSGIRFDGGGAVTVADSPSLNPDYITILIWVKFNSFVNNAGIISKGDTSNRQYWFWSRDTGEIWVNLDGTNYYADNFGNIALNVWCQLVVTYDGARFKTYKNGIIVVDTAQTTGAIFVDDGPLYIAFIDNYSYGDIYVDHAMIWNRALFSPEIALLYRAPFCMFERGVRPERFFIEPVVEPPVVGRIRSHLGFRPIEGAERLRGLRRNALY